VRERTRRLLVALGLPVVMPVESWDEVIEAAGRDKKVTAAGSGFVCLRAVGDPVWGVPVPADVFREGLEVIRL
jgi:3-dehydroquinate synthetase